MTVHVNGTAREIEIGTTLAALVEALNVTQGACATEVNQRLVTRRDRPSIILKDGDRIELVTLVGGG